jgi:Zn-dependent peptidase ImmA (M78 family)/transcriptional regulator with XRE-family HTH domain
MPAVSTPDFYPERLEEAVKARGLTWKDLADAADVRTSTLSEYKNEKATPSPEQLRKIAAALEFPEAFFLQPVTVGAKLTGPRLFRAPSSLTKRAAEQAETRLSLMSECLVFSDRFLRTPESSFLQSYSHIEEPLLLDNSQIEAIAVSVREKLGYGLQPITNLVRTLEKSGIAILRYESLTNVKIDGLSQHSELGRPLCAIFAREEPSLSREYFSLAHELGHIVLHARISESRFDSLADAKSLEDQANRFASAFLLPAAPFLAALAAPTLNFFAYLKRQWRASIAAMIRRCYDLNRIDRDEYSRLNIRLSQKRWKVREPLDDVFEIEHPVLLKQVFSTLAEREGIKGHQIATMLSRNPRDLASISGLPASFFLDMESADNVLNFSGA